MTNSTPKSMLLVKRLRYLLICAAVWISKIKAENYLEDNYSATIIEDARLHPIQLLHKYGYPAETYSVTTEDNYVLCLHRIPKPGGRPVLLVHGLLDSSVTWIKMGPWSSLGYLLSDQGYDVWMGNVRGNRFSRNHTSYNPDKNKLYWKFSWHEIGLYDLPAMIDFVLNETGFRKLGYFGHSQGTTSFWVMASMRPNYNDKITMMHALAPVAFMKNIKAPLFTVASNFIKMSADVIDEFLPYSDMITKYCFTSKMSENTCLDICWQALGKDEKQLNMTMLPVILGQFPSGCSLRQVLHYIQLVENNRFSQFDYGPLENIRRFGQLKPPDYPLEKIRAPVALYYASNDYLSSEVDVQRLANILPTIVELNFVAERRWNHISVLWGIDARELVYKHMLELMLKFE